MSSCARADAACLLGLAQPPVELGGVELAEHLAGLDAVAFAHRRALRTSAATLALTTALFDRLQAARDLERAHQLGTAARHDHVGRRQVERQRGRPGAASCACSALRASSARATSAPSSSSASSGERSTSGARFMRGFRRRGAAARAVRHAGRAAPGRRAGAMKACGSTSARTAGAQAPSECLCRHSMTIGSDQRHAPPRARRSARNSPRSMPRCRTPPTSCVAGSITSSAVELRDLGEVAHLGDDDLEDAGGRACRRCAATTA